MGEQNLQEAVGEESDEGQGLYPELEDFLTSMSGPKETAQPPLEWKKVHYDIFDAHTQKQPLEELSTRLAKGEDCILCNEETFFTKEGRYMVVLKWAEYKVKGANDAGSTSAQPGLAAK
jgi:hypothetical protein